MAIKLEGLLIPKERNFFKMLNEQAKKAEEGAEAFEKFLESNSTEDFKKVLKVEDEGDELRRNTMINLAATFVTPVDRDDISNISKQLDDILDELQTATERMNVYKIKGDGHCKRMANLVRKAVQSISKAITHFKENKETAMRDVLEAKTYNKEVKEEYNQALENLYGGQLSMEVIKMREIYRHIRDCGKATAETANCIMETIVKTT